jgi:PBP1b-binding outer membrane lipoprotein LpoB
MRKTISSLCCAILLAGCATHNSTPAKPDPLQSAPVKPVVTPDFRPVGKVALVNAKGQFVIITYSPGELPKPDTRLSIYRDNLKVAEVKVDGQRQMGNNTAADILTGNILVGDEARQD